MSARTHPGPAAPPGWISSPAHMARKWARPELEQHTQIAAAFTSRHPGAEALRWGHAFWLKRTQWCLPIAAPAPLPARRPKAVQEKPVKDNNPEPRSTPRFRPPWRRWICGPRGGARKPFCESSARITTAITSCRNAEFDAPPTSSIPQPERCFVEFLDMTHVGNSPVSCSQRNQRRNQRENPLLADALRTCPISAPTPAFLTSRMGDFRSAARPGLPDRHYKAYTFFQQPKFIFYATYSLRRSATGAYIASYPPPAQQIQRARFPIFNFFEMNWCQDEIANGELLRCL